MTNYRTVNAPQGSTDTELRFISADGAIAAGYYVDSSGNYDYFVFDIATGAFTDVKDPNAPNNTTMSGLSADGSMAVGTYENSSGVYVGFVENVATGVYTDVVNPTSVGDTFLAGVTGDGSTVLGLYSDGSVGKGFVENLSTHSVTEIADPNTSTDTGVTAISGDGSIVGGVYSINSSHQEGFVFNTITGEYTDVADPNATGTTVIDSISANGSMVAGNYIGNTLGSLGSDNSVGFVEDLATHRYRDVSDPHATDGTYISAISADGSTVVGYYTYFLEEIGSINFSFTENLATGVYTELDPPNSFPGGSNYASAVSGDGSIVVGACFDDEFATDGYVASDIACYGRGTSILTVSGEVAVEDLTIGDLVVTASGEAKPILWIGHRMVDCVRHPSPHHVWPIRISAGAFGENLPRRDLWLSPGHNVAFDGGLIEAQILINGRSVVQVERDRIEYWHIELDVHDVILAEGLPAETYLDTGNRTAFANGGAFVDAHPDFQPKHWAQTCLPLIFDGAPLLRARTRLRERQSSLGYETTTEADLHILADGARIAPTRISASRFAFVLPGTCAEIRLASRSFVPVEVFAESEDFRVLGICIGRLQIDGDEVALDDSSRFAAGWHACEPGQRWTDGAAELPAKARLVVIDLVGEGHYWREAPAAEIIARSHGGCLSLGNTVLARDRAIAAGATWTQASF